MSETSREQYTEKVDVRLLPSQKKAVEQAAQRLGLSASSWVRMIVLDRLDPER